VLLSSSARLHANGTAAFAARLHKPVRPDRLLTTLLSVLRPDKGSGTASHADPAVAPAHPARRLRVLVAEDHAVNAHLIGLYLRQLGHSGEHVTNGALAVEAARRGEHDLVLMDAQMPVMGGVDATRAIRALPGPQPRIIAVTASVLASDRSAFMAAGADDFLSKPVRLATLRTALERWLPAPDEQPPSPPSLPAPRDGAVADDVLDAETVEELRDLGADAFAHLYTSYVGTLLDSVEAILAAAAGSSWSEDDEASVPRLAHRLKGSSAAMGAARLAELCQLLQTASAPSADADRALAALREEGSRVRGAVTALLSTGE
jgi:CheY-like chemotaxis protein/HPt (histidine-containing phosphotransfer) domain-containing protein